MSPEQVALICAGLAGFGILLAITGWLVTLFIRIGKPAGFTLKDAGRPVSFALFCILSGGLIIGVAIIGLAVVGLWWLLPRLLALITPGDLALISIGVGVFPLILMWLSLVAAKLMGGRVDGGGAEGCQFLGRDMNGVVEALFISHVLGFFTTGLAMLGLIASGIWALLR